MKLLLDTVTFLFLIAEPKRLSKAARDAIVYEENDVLLSSVSTWEIAVKHALGRLPLSGPPSRVIPEQRERHGVEELCLDEVSALQLPTLPDLHRDPFDRMLVCQAIVHALAIVTPDESIARYPIRTIW
jgi:PIN domain nuclease of toxin-antitoxin system